jgi:pyruvate dehydrogenase E2 component (dihydrolipoamide acetyltransferase)/2-oxoglutarate dehydrogenase E2 component (dihydrolipoamide succinyltransferase)
MPLDVILPALGMAQESGVIVAWHKHPGEAVAEGDILFEVETDKATVEVEAQGAGFLTGVSAKAGDEVPVGQVIARISASAEGAEPEAEAEGPPADEGAQAEAPALPEGREVIMPTLGMAQDSGLLVGWLVAPGAHVGPEDPLFEVETDKSTVEVPAGAEGYLAALLAEPGEEVPTGQVIAILTAEAPAETLQRSAAGAAAPAAEEEAERPTAAPPAPERPEETPKAAPAPAAEGRILASPKARRLALEAGLDLNRLVSEGLPQPYHARDIERLKALPPEPAAAPAPEAAARGLHLTAEVPVEGFTAFADWAAREADLTDPKALLAALAGPCLGRGAALVRLEQFNRTLYFTTDPVSLGAVAPAEEAAPDLILRDLRDSAITGLRLGPEAAPVLSLLSKGAGLSLTLEAAPGQLSPQAALRLLTDFAGRLSQPLRALL